MKKEIIIAAAGSPNGTFGGIFFTKEANSSFGSYNTFTSSRSSHSGNGAEMDVLAGICVLKQFTPRLSGSEIILFIDYHVVFSKKVHKLRKFMRELEENLECKIHLRLQDKEQQEPPEGEKKTSEFLIGANQLANGNQILSEETEEQLRTVGLFRGHVNPGRVNHLLLKTVEIFNAIFQLNGGLKRVPSFSTDL